MQNVNKEDTLLVVLKSVKHDNSQCTYSFYSFSGFANNG